MRTLFLVIGTILFLIGLLYIYFPNLVLGINAWGRKVLFNDTKVLFYRKKIGLIYILVSAIVIYFILFLPLPEYKLFSNQIVRNKLFKAYSNFYSDKYDKAYLLCQQVLIQESNNLRALELLALIHHTKGEHRKSRIYCKKILRLDPDNIKIKKLLNR